MKSRNFFGRISVNAVTNVTISPSVRPIINLHRQNQIKLFQRTHIIFRIDRMPRARFSGYFLPNLRVIKPESKLPIANPINTHEITNEMAESLTLYFSFNIGDNIYVR